MNDSIRQWKGQKSGLLIWITAIDYLLNIFNREELFRASK